MIIKNTSCAVLMTCHNRKSKTLACLASLFSKSPVRCDDSSEIRLSCFVVNDGCTDGTDEAIKQSFPQVHIIQGSGQLYWNQGMLLAWKKALQLNDYDYFLWLNDDVVLDEDIVGSMIATMQNLQSNDSNAGALVGTLRKVGTLEPSYGGRHSLSRIFPLKYGPVIKPDSTRPTPCEFINGNCTLISKLAVDKVGVLSSSFTHSMGDFDYGLRMKDEGLTAYVAPYFVGECENNQHRRNFTNRDTSLSERINLIKKPNIMPPPKEWRVFVKRHAGVFWPIYYLKAWLRELLPILWVVKWN